MKLAFKPTTGMHPFTVSHLDGLLQIRTAANRPTVHRICSACCADNS